MNHSHRGGEAGGTLGAQCTAHKAHAYAALAARQTIQSPGGPRRLWRWRRCACCVGTEPPVVLCWRQLVETHWSMSEEDKPALASVRCESSASTLQVRVN